MLGRRVPALALTIRRPPLAVRRACLRRRAFYASPCQATAPSLERFTHRAHSAGPLRPEVELTPSKVRKSNLCSSGGTIGVKSCQEPSETLLEPGCRAMRFSEALGSVLDTPGTSKIVLPIFAKFADRARGSKIDPILVQNRGQKPPWSRPGGV